MDATPPGDRHTEALGDYASLAEALDQIATKVSLVHPSRQISETDPPTCGEQVAPPTRFSLRTGIRQIWRGASALLALFR